MSQKFATVNMERVLSETGEGKRIVGEIRQREEPKKKQYQNMVNDIVGLRNRLQKAAGQLKPEEGLQLRQELEKKEMLAMRFQETTLRELEQYRLEMMAAFEKQVFPVIDRISKEKALTFLFPFPQRWIIFADPGVDITDDLITAIDKEVKPGSAAASKPQSGGLGTAKRPKGNIKV